MTGDRNKRKSQIAKVLNIQGGTGESRRKESHFNIHAACFVSMVAVLDSTADWAFPLIFAVLVALAPVLYYGIKLFKGNLSSLITLIKTARCVYCVV